MRALLLAALFIAACGGSPPTAKSAPTAHPALLDIHGAVADKEQFSFVAPQASWTLEWSYTCAPSTDVYACGGLIVAVYGPDRKKVDEIIELGGGTHTIQNGTITYAPKADKREEHLGAGTFYLWVDAKGTSNWSVVVRKP